MTMPPPKLPAETSVQRFIADPGTARSQSNTQRSVTEVAVGVLLRPDGAFLLTSRPVGKAYAGYWEFPGGKLEAGESIGQALSRELHEELGITVRTHSLWKTTEVDYPHALVRLHFCKVQAWSGELEMREQQRFSWEQLPVQVTPVLPGTVPVLDWFADERHFQGATHTTTTTPNAHAAPSAPTTPAAPAAPTASVGDAA
jgi:8-oxo-dGTP diphosphatase